MTDRPRPEPTAVPNGGIPRDIPYASTSRPWRPDWWKIIPRSIATALAGTVLYALVMFMHEGCTRRDLDSSLVEAMTLLGTEEIACTPGDAIVWQPSRGRFCYLKFYRSERTVFCPAHGPCTLLTGLTVEQKSAILQGR